MPARTDIKKILIIGSGPVVIGQANEFDLFGYQAARTLRELGYEVICVNSSPATAMTDPKASDRTYIEPLELDSLTKIIQKERPNALLSTVGGQTALNLVTFLDQKGVLSQYHVEVIGASEPAIARAENPLVFKEAMSAVGIAVPRGGVACSLEDGMQIIRDLGFPAVLRAAYTAGGAGSAIAYNIEEFVMMISAALDASPTCQVVIEQSVLGWKQVQVEVVRDCRGNCITLATMECIDAVGVHPGDSAVVLPTQTVPPEVLANLEKIARDAVGAVEVCGGASVRFAVKLDGEAMVLGIYPGLSRDSALAGKATGVAVASAAAKLAVGFTLAEIGLVPRTPQGCVVRLPRFAFEKFPQADVTLTTSMKSVGEAAAFGADFQEAVQKAIRSLATGRQGLGSDGVEPATDIDVIREKLVNPNPDRLFFVRCALDNGMSASEISAVSGIDKWFVSRIGELIDFEGKLRDRSLVSVSAEVLLDAKRLGYSDAQLASILETDEEQVRIRRGVLGINSSFMATDSGALYSTYGKSQSHPSLASDKKIIILCPGPNAIGQGAEFDYTCTAASRALMEEGYESIIVNCSPAAISTEEQSSTRLYFEPVVLEHVLGIIEREKPLGVIALLGGRSSLSLLQSLKHVKLLGTSPKNVQRAKDRKHFGEFVRKLGLRQIDSAEAGSIAEATNAAVRLGYPLLARSGGVESVRAVEIIYDEGDLTAFVEAAPGRTMLLYKFLEDATEVGVDAIRDGETTLVCGVLEYIEQAGVHAADSACALPPHSLSRQSVDEIKRQTRVLAGELEIVGLLNVQFAVKDGDIYVLNVSPYASRTLPFVSRATGVEWAAVAARVMIGKSLKEQGITGEIEPGYTCVKESVFPFARFAGIDVDLGPEMKSTGVVMGMNTNFGSAYIKAQLAAGQDLPERGTAFLSVADRDKQHAGEVGKKLRELGFDVVATRGTARALGEAGVDARVISKIGEGRPDATDLIKNGEIDLIINTRSGKKPRQHEVTIRSAVVARGIPIITTMAGARATLVGMETVRQHGATVRALQDYEA